MRTPSCRWIPTTLVCALAGCSLEKAESPAVARNALDRAEFNALAVRTNTPLYWIDDRNGNGAAEDDEIARLLFYPPLEGTIDEAYARLVAAKVAAPLDETQPDGRRRALVRKDLAAGRPSLVLTDLSTFSPGERSFVDKMLSASRSIDALHAVQTGAAALEPRLPADAESRSLFRRNAGAACVGPETQHIAECSAIPGAPAPVVDVYPAKLDGIDQNAPGFCARLQQPGRDPALIDPFTVVREIEGQLRPVPYSTAYASAMGAVANDLEAAAEAIDGAGEAALVEYLRAAARAFRDNLWWPADEAWARMGPDNSKWYVRVAPDEVYWDPCGFKAGFHLTLARINQGSRDWQAKLSTVQQDMEQAIAAASGPPYRARKVGFDLPDFIDIVTNAGDDRSPLSGTIGQSLPNFGPVAKESRGRTVAMVNLFNEVDGQRSRRAAAESLLDAASMVDYADDATAGNLTTILHEATHNLGPTQESTRGGKTERAIFGGPVSSLMEELKAETGALFLIEPLRMRGIIDERLARQAYTQAITWAFGHIAQGMYTEPGHQRKTYSQLSAIQIGFLLDNGALTWDAKATAANGRDIGAFRIHQDKLVEASSEMMKLVGGLKARIDRPGAEALATKYVDGDRVPQALIAERFARSPRASLVYAVKP